MVRVFLWFIAGALLSCLWISLALALGVDTWTRAWVAGSIGGTFSTIASLTLVRWRMSND